MATSVRANVWILADGCFRPKSSSRLRLLVVDDNVDAATSMGMVLELLGIEHMVEFSGEGALTAVECFHPDAVLLDIGMPGMDGYEVARRLRTNPENADMTLIAVTGWSQLQDRQKTRAAGFDHHLSKLADIGALQSMLATLKPVSMTSSGSNDDERRSRDRRSATN